MADISTKYAEKLQLKSPFIVASSGLTNRVDRITKYAEAGAGAVVLKSIFEEQLTQEAIHLSGMDDYASMYSYLDHYVKSHAIEKHIDLLKECRAAVDIPIIASINCYKSDAWLNYAQHLSDAGATALELNVMRIDTDKRQEWGTQERELVALVSELRKLLPDMPITVKLSRYYSNMVRLARDLYEAGANGVVLFNRTFMPDINIEKEEVVAGPIMSSEVEYYDSLRFASLIHGEVRGLSIALSTGARDGADLVKGLLAGANAVQYCTALYKGGADVIRESNDFLLRWLDEHQYHNISEIHGRLAATRVDLANVYQRSQFMKYYSSEDATPTNVYDPIQRPIL
ncbi:MAG: dihydroorotate dehydrogenase-like protein [Porphyromonas sp.]|nr:dihydroorotate dehydrogenase-like protein [Porphyromonas sp.]